MACATNTLRICKERAGYNPYDDLLPGRQPPPVIASGPYGRSRAQEDQYSKVQSQREVVMIMMIMMIY